MRTSIVRNYVLLTVLLSISIISQAQSRLISSVPINGQGNQFVCIHSHSGQVEGAPNLAFNLLYNHAEGEQSIKRWYNNSNWFPWVVFELTDFYTIDKIEFRDVKTQHDQFLNIDNYQIYVSAVDPMMCEWKLVIDKKEQASYNVKSDNLNHAEEVRFIKFVCSPGMQSDLIYDDGIRIYGMDIYGTFSRKYDRSSISVGKSILGFNGSSPYYQTPLNILDGNGCNVENFWYANRPSLSDSLRWVVIDLETTCKITGFQLSDAKSLIQNAPNIDGYNVYVSNVRPDLAKIKANIDENEHWVQVVNAYEQKRLDQAIKTDMIEEVEARYVKLEIPYSQTNGFLRIFQFEVFGEELVAAVKTVNLHQGLSIHPNVIKKGEDVQIYLKESGLLHVVDMNGKLLYNENLSAGQHRIATHQFPSGMYMIYSQQSNYKFVIVD